MIEGQPRSHRTTTVQTLGEVIDDVDRRMRDRSETDVRTVATGFDVLDDLLGGGLHAGELVVLGGPPGVGKTIAALQWARNVARDGHRAIFVCYEHEPGTLLTRLIALEAGDIGGDDRVSRSVARALAHGDAEGRGLTEVFEGSEAGRAALARVRAYADNLYLVRGSGSHTTLEQLDDIVGRHLDPGGRTVLFVDFLQKIPIHPEPMNEEEKVTRTVEGLKDLALERHVPVVLISAVDAQGMRANRIRLYHLRGSSAVAFESDVVLMLNDKDKVVSKVHLSYDPVRARGYRDWVVLSLEKNRGGPNLVDLEHRKDFTHFRLDPAGGVVSETLVSERLDEAAL
jgi:replicative DNA helicase